MIPRMTVGGRGTRRGRFFRILETGSSVLSVTWSRRLHSCQERGGRARRSLSWWRQTLPGHPFHGEFYASRLRNIYFFLLSLFLYFTHLSISGLSNLFLEPRGEWKFTKWWIIREETRHVGQKSSCWKRMLGDGFALYIEKLYKLHIENTDRRSVEWNLGNFNRKSLLGVDEQRFSHYNFDYEWTTGDMVIWKLE